MCMGASNADIKKAYCALAMKWHPDKNPAGKANFQKIQEAHESLAHSALLPRGLQGLGISPGAPLAAAGWRRLAGTRGAHEFFRGTPWQQEQPP